MVRGRVAGEIGPETRRAVAEAAAARGDHAQAVVAWQALLAQGDTPREVALCGLAEAYLAQDAFAPAMDAVAACSAFSPHHAGLSHLRARILGRATQRVILQMQPLHQDGARVPVRLHAPGDAVTRRDLAGVDLHLRWHGQGPRPAFLVVARADGRQDRYALGAVVAVGHLARLRAYAGRLRRGQSFAARVDLIGAQQIGIAAAADTAPRWTHRCLQKELPTVLEGQDGWLFLTNDGNRSDALFTGALQLPPWGWIAWWRYGRALARLEQGRDAPRLAFVIAPAKESVLPGHYPLPRGTRVLTDRVLSILRWAGVAPVYPVARLAAHPGSYCRTDTHWSHLGAFIALEACLERFGLQGDWRGQIDFTPTEVMGDLGGKVSPPVTDPMLVARWPGRGSVVRCLYRSGLDSTGEIVVFETADAPIPEVLVVFGGSSAATLAYLASRIFARVVRINCPLTQPVTDVIRAEGARYVICQTNERYLMRAPRVVARLQDSAIPRTIAGLDPLTRKRVAEACATADADDPYARFVTNCLQQAAGRPR